MPHIYMPKGRFEARCIRVRFERAFALTAPSADVEPERRKPSWNPSNDVAVAASAGTRMARLERRHRLALQPIPGVN